MKTILAALAFAVAVTACTDPSASPPPPTGTTPPPPADTMPATPTPPPVAAAPVDPVTEAATIFGTRCATCHGANGLGDGVAAAAFPVKPRNYTDAAWQKGITDEQIAKTIVEGGAAMGKSPLMAPNLDLKDKPEVVKALVAKVRSFGPK